MQTKIIQAFLKCIALGSISVLLFSGCGSKYYFEPKDEEIKGEISYSGKLPAEIVSIVRDGATLKNGQFITKYSEIPSVRLERGAFYLNQSEQYYIAQSGKNLILINKQTEEKIVIALENIPVSASIDGNLAAIILDTNTLIIYHLESMQIIFKQDNVPAPANNTLIASPYFLNDIVVLPTLDGKLVVVDKKSMQLVRNIVVNGDKFFNNVIYLEAIGDRMVAATPKRIISVSPSVINTFDANIRDILFFEDRIFIFTNEGEVILTDRDLNVTQRKKFRFAHFTAANHGKDIVILETQGYMILLNDTLEYSRIERLPDAIDVRTFSATDKIFIGDHFITIQ